uniref:Transcription elongation factor, mitochondrial n=1 Tax=Salmo trutta TaxID=8032 RepID=A0A674EN16_SALTR
MWVAMRFGSLIYGLFYQPQGSLPKLQFLYLNCTCCWRSRIPVAGFETLNDTLSSSTTLCDDDKSLDAYYTSEQRDVILQLLNNAAESELAAVKLLCGHKSVNICYYMCIYPLLPFFQEANSIVSIVCGVNKIAWAHVDRGINVLEWKHEDCHNFLKGTYMASAYLDDISRVVSHLPTADFFVVEKPSISLQNTALNPVMAHMRTVEAIMFVLNMMRTAVGRHFGLMVGESRTSGAQAVQQMTESVTQIPRVTFPHNLLVKYRNSFQVGGAELCDAMLQAVAFYELLSESS